MKRNTPGNSTTWILMVTALAALLSMPAGVFAQAGEEGAVAVAPPAAQESEPVRPTFSADMGIFSQYIWRGTAYSRDSAVFQPSLTVEYWGFSFNLWGNLDLGVPASETYAPWNETDMTVAYDRSFGPVGVGAGYIYYALDSLPGSQEAYITVGVDTILSPSFTAYREFAHYPGWYLNLGLSQSFDLITDHLALDLGATFGYLDVDNGPGYFNDAGVSVGFTIPIGEYFTVAPMVAYTFYLSGAAMNNLMAGSVDGKGDHIYGGATLSLAF